MKTLLNEIPRVSASNAAKLYSMSFENEANLEHTGDWQFVSHLSTEQVWDAFVIYSLLDEKKRHREQLKVPHTGLQSDRFKQAMEERTQDIILNGQPDAVLHACDKCFRCYETQAGEFCGYFQLSSCKI